MKTQYRVWITIEKITEEENGEAKYEDVSPFPVMLGSFDSIEKADQVIIELTGETSLR